MPAVGNDIVNLGDPANRRKSMDRRFLNRVFTDSEQALIAGAGNPERLLWSLWSAKEAAYKVASKLAGPVSSAPRRYVFCPLFDHSFLKQSLLSGRVDTPVLPVFVRFALGCDFIHCLCADEASVLDRIHAGISRLEDRGSRKDNQAYESWAARQAAREAIAAILHLAPEDVEIRREGADAVNPPVAYCRGQRLAVDLSLSHDFPWVGYAFIV